MEEYIKSNFYEDCIQSNYDNKELIKEIKEHPTMRLDAGYWIQKKEREEKKLKKSQSKAYFKAVEDGHGRLE